MSSHSCLLLRHTYPTSPLPAVHLASAVATQQEHQGCIEMLVSAVWFCEALSSAMISSSRNNVEPLYRNGNKSSKRSVWLPMLQISKTVTYAILTHSGMHLLMYSDIQVYQVTGSTCKHTNTHIYLHNGMHLCQVTGSVYFKTQIHTFTCTVAYSYIR